jgi:putative flavoprotein involved in K+ transport
LYELPVERFDVAIVGGGPGGLAISQQLAARRISNVILERGDHAGWMWGQVYDSLRLHTGKHLSSLPGMPFPAHTSLFPTRSEFAEYIESYVDKFKLPIRTGVEATGLLRENGGWTVETGAARYQSNAVVVATGIMSSPVLPDFQGTTSYTRLMLIPS